MKGCKMYQVVQKLKKLKPALKNLHSQQFRNIVMEAEKDRETLKLVQQRLQIEPLNAHLQKEEKAKYLAFKKLSYLAEVYLQQKSKVNWVKLGDDKTSYFYAVIKHRKLKHEVTQVRNTQEEMEHDPPKIAAIFVDYYMSLLAKKKAGRIIASNYII